MQGVSSCYPLRTALCAASLASLFASIFRDSRADEASDTSLWRNAAVSWALFAACISLSEMSLKILHHLTPSWVLQFVTGLSISPRCVPYFENVGRCALVQRLVLLGLVEKLTTCDCISECIWLPKNSFSLFLLHGEVLDVLVTHGFFDHVTLLVLRIQSHAPLSFHILSFVLHIDFGYLEFLVSS